MPMSEKIRARLEAVFSPTFLEIHDDSEAHRGHAGFQDGGESHWQVKIKAPAFAEMSRVARHRAVHDALGPEIIGAIHALQLEIDG